MNLVEAIIMGIFQGIAEFLPISSSGHLALLQYYFGIEEGNLFFSQMLHFGTLISIIIVYFKEILIIIKEILELLANLLQRKKITKLTGHQKLGLFVIIGTIPTAIIGLTFEDLFESLYTSLLPIGIALIITGFLLWIAEKNTFQHKNMENMSIFDSLIIGFFQGLAIIPGISRSGTTIVTGMFRGLEKPLATEFSFLLAIPALLGGFILGIRKVIKGGSAIIINFPLFVGVFLSATVGVFSLKLLINLLKKNKLHYFFF